MRKKAAITITRDEIQQVLGPVEDTLTADIVATGAAFQELVEAFRLEDPTAPISAEHRMIKSESTARRLRWGERSFEGKAA